MTAPARRDTLKNDFQSIRPFAERDHKNIVSWNVYDKGCLVALNFSAQDQVVTLPGQSQGRVLLSTHLDREGLVPFSEMHLRGNEGLLLEVEAPSLPGS